MKGDGNMKYSGSIQERLKQAYMINLKDSERLVSIAQKSNDPDLLKRAQADWQIWHDKLQAFSSI